VRLGPWPQIPMGNPPLGNPEGPSQGPRGNQVHICATYKLRLDVRAALFRFANQENLFLKWVFTSHWTPPILFQNTVLETKLTIQIKR